MLKFLKKLLGIQSPSKMLHSDWSSVDSSHIVEDLLGAERAAEELLRKRTKKGE